MIWGTVRRMYNSHIPLIHDVCYLSFFLLQRIPLVLSPTTSTGLFLPPVNNIIQYNESNCHRPTGDAVPMTTMPTFIFNPYTSTGRKVTMRNESVDHGGADDDGADHMSLI